MRERCRSARKAVVVCGGAWLLLLSVSAGAYAQASRTWVSGVGDDANPCSRTAPCKTFAGAISKTAAGGEISVLDPGGYGAVIITKAITITSETAGEAGVLVSGTNGIVVNAGADAAVTLRGLVIHGLGTGLDGVRFIAGAALHVEKSLITGFTGDGIDASLAAAADLTVSDSEIRGCGGSGIALADSAGRLRTVLRNVRIQRAGAAVRVAAGATVSLHGCDLTQSATGVLADGATARVFADGNQVSLNTTGVLAAAGAKILLNDNSIYGNATGLSSTGGGGIESFTTNRISGNGVNGAPTLRRALK